MIIMQLITFQEGFFDAVKERVQTNLNNMANAAHTVVNKVSSAGQSIQNTANQVRGGVNKFQNFIGTREAMMVNSSPNPTQAMGGSHNTLATNIKKQSPPGAANTTAVFKRNSPTRQ